MSTSEQQVYNKYTINGWLYKDGIRLNLTEDGGNRYKVVVVPVSQSLSYIEDEYPEMVETWTKALDFYDTVYFGYDKQDVINTFLHYSLLGQRYRSDSDNPDDVSWCLTGNESAWESCNLFYHDHLREVDDDDDD